MNHFKLFIPVKSIFIAIILALILSACNYSKVDQRNRPDGAKAKARKNLEEGKGVSLGNLGKKLGRSEYEFSTSNPLWRASLETLDFLPLTTVDYSGGIILGYKVNKHLGTFIEGKYNKYWNREWYDFKFGVNYVIF